MSVSGDEDLTISLMSVALQGVTKRLRDHANHTIRYILKTIGCVVLAIESDEE